MEDYLILIIQKNSIVIQLIFEMMRNIDKRCYKLRTIYLKCVNMSVHEVRIPHKKLGQTKVSLLWAVVSSETFWNEERSCIYFQREESRSQRKRDVSSRLIRCRSRIEGIVCRTRKLFRKQTECSVSSNRWVSISQLRREETLHFVRNIVHTNLSADKAMLILVEEDYGKTIFFYFFIETNNPS